MSQELKKLIALKLEVIQFHTGTENEYIRNSMAHDACFTANNSVKYKEEIISENRGTLKGLLVDDNGSEVVSTEQSRLARIIKAQEAELKELDLRFKADCAVFKQLTNKACTPKSKASGSNSKLMMKSEVEAIANG